MVIDYIVIFLFVIVMEQAASNRYIVM